MTEHQLEPATAEPSAAGRGRVGDRWRSCRDFLATHIVGPTRAWWGTVRSATVPLILLLVISTVIVSLNFRGAFTINFIDNSWPLDPAGSLRGDLFVWNPEQMGTLNLLATGALPLLLWDSALQAVHLTPGAQELVTIALLQWVAAAAFFLLFERFLLRRAAPALRRPLSVVAALGCVINLAVQSVYWWDFLPEGFELLAFGGLFLYLLTCEFERFLDGDPARPWRVLALGVSGAIAFSVNVPFNLSLLALALFFPVFAGVAAGLRIDRTRRVLAFLGITVVGVALLSLWWLFPSAEVTALQPTYVVQQSASINSLEVFRSSTAPITFLNVLEGNVGYPVQSAGHYAVTYLLASQAATFLLLVPLAAIVVALVRGGSWQRLPLILAMTALFVQGLFVTGVNSPLYPWVFDALFRNPVLLTALRTPFVAFGESVAVIWVSAVALAASVLYDAIRGGDAPARESVPRSEPHAHGSIRRAFHAPRSGVVLGLGLVAVLFLPAFAAAPSALAGDAVPLSPYQSRMSVAPYETEVANFLHGQLDGQYALLYPGGFLEQNWSQGYDGYDILPSLLPGSFLIDNYREGFVVNNNSLLTDAYGALASNEPNLSNLSGLLGRLGVKDLVIEGALGGSFPFGQSIAPNYARLLPALNNTSGLALARTFGPDLIYTVSAPHGLLYLAGSSAPASSLLEGSVQPRVDLTAAYLNASEVTTPLVPYQWLYPRPNGTGFDFGASPSAKANASPSQLAALQALPSPLTLFNGVPLNVSAAPGDCLLLNFTTNAATAVSFTLVTSPDLRSTTLAGSSWAVEGAASNLGDGDGALLPYYGAGHFISPGRPTTLVDRLPETITGGAASTWRYLLISLWPVLPNGSGVRGSPLRDWPATQWVHIGQVALGQDLFLAPPAYPARVFDDQLMSNGGPVNETASFDRGLLSRTGSEPPNPLPALTTPGGVDLFLNASLRQRWNASSSSLLYRAYGEPTWYNRNCLSVVPSADPYLILNLTAAEGTAFTLALVPDDDLSNLTANELDAASYFAGGLASPQGSGDPLLVPAYGALHFVTNGSPGLLVDDIGTTLESVHPATPLCHLVISEFFVQGDGMGARGVPPVRWTGNQSVLVRSVFAAPYLVRGDALDGPPPGLNGSPFQAGRDGLSSGSRDVVVIPGPALQFATGAQVSYSEQNPTQYSATIVNGTGAPLGGPVMLVLSQTFHVDWELGAIQGVRNWTHFDVDASLNGFLLYPERGTVSLSVVVRFAAQSTFAAALVLGPVVPVAIAAAVWARPRLSARFHTGLRTRDGRQ